MRALTIKQPWAELIAMGEKRVENRTWWTRYTGPILIHAAASRGTVDGVDWVDAVDPSRCEFGKIIAVAELKGCVAHALIPTLRGTANEWLDSHPYAEGPWCWVLANVRRLSSPIPCRGRLGLWTPSADIIERVNRDQLEPVA